MNTSRLNHHVRHNWEIVFLLLLILILFCLAGGLLVRRVTDVSIYEFLPVALDSVLATDYGLDPNPTRRPPLRLDIIWDTLHDHDPDAEDLAERMAVLLDKLQTPVPAVTPQLCQGRHVIFATRDTWLDSTRPTGVYGAETALRLGFSDTGRKRLLLYFPVSDRIPPGTFIGRARLELDLPPGTPAAAPGGVCFFNLNSSFDETGTNWSNQPEAYLPYCSQPIPGTGRLHTWDVTGLVNDWLQGHYPNSGLMIDLASPAAIEPVYLSREAAGLANFQTGDPARQVGPRLVIDCGGAPPAPEPGEIAQVPPAVTPELPAGTGIPSTPAIAATGTALAGSPPPVSATPPATPVIPPTGTRAATVTAPAASPTRPVSTGSPTPAATSTRPVSTGSPTPATSPTRPVSTGSPTPATSPTRPVSTGSPVAPSPTVPPATATSVPATSTSAPATSTSAPATSTSVPPEPTSKPSTSTPTATWIPTSTPSPTATASPTATSIPQADLVINKSASVDPVLAGANLTYILDITNNGPAAATGVTVTDNLPPAVNLVSAASSQGGCTGTGTLTCTLGDISPGGAASITVVVNVPAGAAGTLANSATVSAGQADPNPANNTATAVTTISRAADLAISKSDSPDPVAAGQTLTYTLSAVNNGPSTATGLTVSDTLPAGLTFISASSGCSQAGGMVTCTVSSLASGGNAQYQVVVALPAGITGTLTNQAEINAAETDPNPANNTAVVTTTVTPAADLSITKSANPGSVNAGQPINYMLSLTNNGPANATGVVITDTLPPGVTVITAPGCAINGNILTCPAGNVDSGKDANQVIIVRVNPETPPGSITNLAQVGGSEFDPIPGNNTATVGAIITTSADLAASISAAPEVAIPGGSLAYTIVVSNSGPSAAAGAVITDTLPANVAFTSAPAGCTHATGRVTCDAGSLASGASRTYQVVVDVDPAASGTLINSATVTGSEADPDTGNNTATISTTVLVEADLVISKSDSPDPVVAGDTLTYTLAITNNGPAIATGVVFTDTLPAAVAFASAPAGCTHTAGVVTCAVGSLASGATRTYPVVVAVDPAAGGTLINTATVAGNETDPVSNNTSTVGTTVTAEADLAISKSVDNAAPLEQDQVLYTVTIVNGGPSHATGVVISDPLPVGLTYVSDNSAGSYNSGSGVWTVGNLANSAGVTLLVTATVNTETAGKTITNTALIDASDQADPAPGNNTASVTITPALPALSINDVTISEGDSGTTVAIFTVTLSAASAQTVTVSYGTADNTATLADNDYNTAGGALTFSPGVTTQTVTVQVNGDTALESNETFFVNLSNPAGAGITVGQGQGAILDDDGLSTITLTDVWDAWMNENNPGNTHGDEDNMQVKPPSQEYRTLINFHTLTTALPAGSTVLSATLHLYQDGVRSGQAISIYPLTTNWVEGEVKWSKAANGPGGDWLNPAGGGDFDTGATWATFDPATDGHRYINITGLVQAWLAGTYDNYGMILISTSSGLDDGAVKFYTHEHATPAWRPSLEIIYTTGGSVSPLSLSIGNVTVSEGDSGTTPAVFNVTLSGASTQTVTVDYATADNTATTADNDYLATGGTLTFAPGVTQRPITVTVVGDTKPENSQSFFVNLSNPQNAAIAGGQGLGTILQDVGGLSLPEGAGGIRLYLPVIVKPGH